MPLCRCPLGGLLEPYVGCSLSSACQPRQLALPQLVEVRGVSVLADRDRFLTVSVLAFLCRHPIRVFPAPPVFESLDLLSVNTSTCFA